MKIFDSSTPAVLTTKQVAKLLGVTAHTLTVNRSYGGRLNIPYFKLGRLVRYSRSDVEAFLAKAYRRG